MKALLLFFALTASVLSLNASDELIEEAVDLKLLEQAMISAHFFEPERVFVSGVETVVDAIDKKYPIAVPGSEGFPGRCETRIQKTIKVSNPVAHNFEVNELTFKNLQGEDISREDAEKSILKNKSFLLADGERSADSLANALKSNDSLVVATRKKA
jgi:hypothetical protein